MVYHFSPLDLVLFVILSWSLWYLAGRWHGLLGGQKLNKPRKRRRRRLKPRSADDCWRYRMGLHLDGKPATCQVTPWRELKGPARRKKRACSQGYACPNPRCHDFGVTDADLHALVSNGWKGKGEQIRQWKCQAFGKRLSERLHTPLYRLKAASKRVAEVMTALAEGVDVSATMRIFTYHHTTIGRWLVRGGRHGRELHERTFRDFVAEHLQMDELKTRVKCESERVWLPVVGAQIRRS